jgi:hypothetical protein
MSLKARITEDVKAAMRGGEKLRLGTLRMLTAAIKQREVDDRREMTDTEVLQIVEKLIKQRREAASQFASGGRTDLEAKELEEAGLLSAYLPAQLSEAELSALLEEAIQGAGATGIKDMGKVMNTLRPKVQGRADMSQVSNLVKARLTG